MRGAILKLNNIFYSFEGEGRWQGYPTIFIRLAGCNIACAWCDTDHSMRCNKTPQEIMDKIRDYPASIVKITGGEPLLQSKELEELVILLKDLKYLVSLETNGTIFNEAIFGMVDLICMDIKTPGSREKSLSDVITQTDAEFPDKTEFKMVISNGKDLDFISNNFLVDSRIVITPVTGPGFPDKALLERILYEFPDCRLGVRLHVIMQVD
jgi:7-carboxy-7-deazaguanine synthase